MNHQYSDRDALPVKSEYFEKQVFIDSWNVMAGPSRGSQNRRTAGAPLILANQSFPWGPNLIALHSIDGYLERV